MYSNKRVSLVIPCYNEEQGLDIVLNNKPVFIDELIVIDNDSSDRTSEIAGKYGVKAVYLKEKGYGLACQAGLRHASGEIIIIMDADNSYPILETKKFLAHMESKQCDFITGCRFPLMDKHSMPFIRRVSNYFISWLIRKCFHIQLTDSQTGMFVLKRHLLETVIPSNCGMGFTQEIKLKAWLNPNIRTAELHINYQKRIGKSKYRPIRDGAKTLWDIFIFLSAYHKRQ